MERTENGRSVSTSLACLVQRGWGLGLGGAERADTPEHGLLLMCWVRTAVSEVLQSDSEAQLEQGPQTGGGASARRGWVGGVGF